MDENSYSSLYSEHHNHTMMPFNYSDLSSGIFNNIPCDDDGDGDGDDDIGDAQKSSLGFMELLGGVPEFGSLFDSPSDHFLHAHHQYSPTTTTKVDNQADLHTNYNLPASPNSSSISSSSIEAAPTYNNNDGQPKTAADDHVEVEDEENKKKKQLLKPKKKNQKKERESRVAFMTKSEVDHLEDGYRWRKYGQKAVKNSQYPRSYYRCTNATCGVKKRVERSCTDSTVVVTTYEGQHTHPSPMMPRGGFAAAAVGVSHHPLSSTANYGSGIASLIQMNATHNYLQQHHQQPNLYNLPLVPHHLNLGTSLLPSPLLSNILLGHDQRNFCHGSTFQGDHGLLGDVLPFEHIRKED